MRTVIKNRQEFERYLVEATAKMKALIVNEPDDKTLKAVLRQLEAIQQWTANGQTITSATIPDGFSWVSEHGS